jgi:hypothetical protein
VFLCDRDPEVVAKARITPAKAVLERPLNAVLLGGVIEDICRRHRLDVKEGGDFVRAAAVFPQRDTEVLDDNDVVAPAEAGLGGRRLDDLPADEASVGSASELPEAAAPWFRFFFEARRIIRTSDGIEERRERVFRQLMETCGARMVAWMSCGPSPTAAFPGQLEIQSCWSPKRQVSELEPEDWKRVFHVLSRLPEKWYRDRRGDTDSLDSRMSTAVVSAEALVVPVFSRSTSRVRLVLALPHSQESMAQLPDAIAEELPYLLGEVER